MSEDRMHDHLEKHDDEEEKNSGDQLSSTQIPPQYVDHESEQESDHHQTIRGRSTQIIDGIRSQIVNERQIDESENDNDNEIENRVRSTATIAQQPQTQPDSQSSIEREGLKKTPQTFSFLEKNNTQTIHETNEQNESLIKSNSTDGFQESELVQQHQQPEVFVREEVNLDLSTNSFLDKSDNQPYEFYDSFRGSVADATPSKGSTLLLHSNRRQPSPISQQETSHNTYHQRVVQSKQVNISDQPQQSNYTNSSHQRFNPNFFRDRVQEVDNRVEREEILQEEEQEKQFQSQQQKSNFDRQEPPVVLESTRQRKAWTVGGNNSVVNTQYESGDRKLLRIEELAEETNQLSSSPQQEQSNSPNEFLYAEKQMTFIQPQKWESNNRIVSSSLSSHRDQYQPLQTQTSSSRIQDKHSERFQDNQYITEETAPKRQQSRGRNQGYLAIYEQFLQKQPHREKSPNITTDRIPRDEQQQSQQDQNQIIQSNQFRSRQKHQEYRDDFIPNDLSQREYPPYSYNSNNYTSSSRGNNNNNNIQSTNQFIDGESSARNVNTSYSNYMVNPIRNQLRDSQNTYFDADVSRRSPTRENFFRQEIPQQNQLFAMEQQIKGFGEQIARMRQADNPIGLAGSTNASTPQQEMAFIEQQHSFVMNIMNFYEFHLQKMKHLILEKSNEITSKDKMIKILQDRCNSTNQVDYHSDEHEIRLREALSEIEQLKQKEKRNEIRLETVQDRCDEEIKEARMENISLTTEIDQLRAQLREVQTKNEVLQTQIDKSHSDYDRIELQFQDFKSSEAKVVDSLKKEIKAKDHTIQELNTAMSLLQTNINNTNSNNSYCNTNSNSNHNNYNSHYNNNYNSIGSGSIDKQGDSRTKKANSRENNRSFDESQYLRLQTNQFNSDSQEYLRIKEKNSASQFKDLLKWPAEQEAQFYSIKRTPNNNNNNNNNISNNSSGGNNNNNHNNSFEAETKQPFQSERVQNIHYQSESRQSNQHEFRPVSKIDQRIHENPNTSQTRLNTSTPLISNQSLQQKPRNTNYYQDIYLNFKTESRNPIPTQSRTQINPPNRGFTNPNDNVIPTKRDGSRGIEATTTLHINSSYDNYNNPANQFQKKQPQSNERLQDYRIIESNLTELQQEKKKLEARMMKLPVHQRNAQQRLEKHAIERELSNVESLIDENRKKLKDFS